MVIFLALFLFINAQFCANKFLTLYYYIIITTDK